MTLWPGSSLALQVRSRKMNSDWAVDFQRAHIGEQSDFGVRNHCWSEWGLGTCSFCVTFMCKWVMKGPWVNILTGGLEAVCWRKMKWRQVENWIADNSEVHYELTHTTEALNHHSSYSLLFLKEKSEIHIQHYGPSLVPMDLYIVFLPPFLSEKMSPFPYEEICNICSSAERHGASGNSDFYITFWIHPTPGMHASWSKDMDSLCCKLA